MSSSTPQTIGKKMAIVAWIIGMVILTQLFGHWEDTQSNPNQDPISSHSNAETLVRLSQNRQGHYRVTGFINQEKADFMVDTGATDIVVPKSLAQAYGLTGKGKGVGLTANGYVELERAVIQEMTIGEIKLYNLRASINPGMSAEQPILLGMSALSQLELRQHSGVLTLVQHK